MTILDELLVAIEKEDLITVKRLSSEHPYLFHFDIPYGWPVLHRCLAAGCANLDLVKLFIANGGDVNRKTNSGVSLVFLAATMSGGHDLHNHLLSCGGRMSTFEEALATIMKEDDEAQARAFIMKLAKREPDLVRQTGDKGFTLLHYAVRDSQCPAAELLLDLGADPNAVSSAGSSPLGLCGRGEDFADCRDLLLAKGARYALREEVRAMLHENRDADAIKWFEANPPLIKAWDPKLGPYLHVAARFGESLDVLEYLLRHGLDPNIPNEFGEIALHQSYRNPAKTRLLIQHGANINHQDYRGYTPLHCATGHDTPETATMLVECGADLNAKTNDGETSLDFVMEMAYPGYRQFASYLKSRGATSGKSKT